MARPRRTEAPAPAPTFLDAEPPFDVIAERIDALTNFVAHVGPCVGERRDGEYLADKDCEHAAVMISRNDALVQAYEAIGKLSARAAKA